MPNRSPRRSTAKAVSIVEPHQRSHFKPFVFFALLCLTAGAGVAHDAHAVLVQIDTSALSGIGRFEFSLFDGDGTAANNSATISGTTIQDFDTTNIDQLVGALTTFDVTFTHNFTPAFLGATPDLLVLNLLDPDTNFTLVDTNLDALAAPVPYQDALLVIDLSNGKFLTPASSTPTITVVVPEPSTVMLLAALGLLYLGRSLVSARRSFARA